MEYGERLKSSRCGQKGPVYYGVSGPRLGSCLETRYSITGLRERDGGRRDGPFSLPLCPLERGQPLPSESWKDKTAPLRSSSSSSFEPMDARWTKLEGVRYIYISNLCRSLTEIHTFPSSSKKKFSRSRNRSISRLSNFGDESS